MQNKAEVTYFMIRNFLKRGDKRGGHPCILPSFHTEETLKYNAISKNYHRYGSTVEYMGAPSFVPPFQKASNHEICYLSFILHQKMNLIAHLEQFICLFKKRFHVQ